MHAILLGFSPFALKLNKDYILMSSAQQVKFGIVPPCHKFQEGEPLKPRCTIMQKYWEEFDLVILEVPPRAELKI